jgi:hypothetical protein
MLEDQIKGLQLSACHSSKTEMFEAISQTASHR